MISKSKMIDEIIGLAKSAAILQNKHLDTGDLFLTLAFSTDEQLTDMCRQLKIHLPS